MEEEPLPELKQPLLSRLGIGVNLSPVIGIFITVFVDLLAFGMVIPDIQLRGKSLATQSLGANSPYIGILIGVTLAVFSFAQMTTSPFLGRLSDRVGRRTILLITTLLSTGAFVLYAHATSLPWMIASRALSGIAGANIGVAFAYVADVTTPEHRAKGMGTVGAAFGLGFILGPSFGGWLITVGGNNPKVLGYVSASLGLINFLYVLLLLPESMRSEHRSEHKRSFLHTLRLALSIRSLAILLAMSFAVVFGFANLETTYFQLLNAPNGVFHLSERDAKMIGALLLALVGVIVVIMQGGLVRILTPRFGEVRLVRTAYMFQSPAIFLVPFMPLWAPAIAVLCVMAAANGLASPSMNSLISRNAPRELQGSVFGLTQSLGAMARLLGPLISNPLFQFRHYAPYVLGSAVILFPAAAAWWIKQPEQGTPDG